jgi:tripartite-type tricarboxylate transporter receptor subunit TctC
MLLHHTRATARHNTANNIVRRMALAVMLAALSLGQFCAASSAKERYPVHPITFIVAFTPGGVADAIARIIGQDLSQRFGQNIVVENRGGAGGNLAAHALTRAAPDGYTVLVTTTSVAINETLYKNKGYETNDITPVAIVASTPDVLAVHSSNPAKSLPDFIKAAKAKGIIFGTAGTGSPSFIGAEYFFKVLANIEVTHVPFQGGAPAVNAVAGNHIDLIAISLPSVAPQIEKGSLRGLGIAAPKRSSTLPGVPTYAESGFPNFYSDSWIGFFVPSKTDPAVITRLNAAIEQGLHEPAVAKRLSTLGFDTIFNSDAEAGTLFRSEMQKWGNMVKAVGIRID